MRFTFLLGSILVPCALLHADTVFLTNGGKIEGKVRRERGRLIVERHDGMVIVDEDKVDRIEEGPCDYITYLDKWAAVQNLNDATAVPKLVEVGRWCQDKRMYAQTEKAYRRVLALDADNVIARVALGFEKFNGAWLTHDEACAAKGMVKYKGNWLTPEAASDIERIEALKSLEKAKADTERARAETALAEAERARAEAMRMQAERDYGRYPYVINYGRGGVIVVPGNRPTSDPSLRGIVEKSY